MARKDDQQIIELEKKFWQSIVDNDVDTSVAMLDEGSVVTGAQGVRMMSRDDYRRMAEQGSGKYELKSFKFADVQVSFPTNDVAVIAYKVTESMDVDGKPLDTRSRRRHDVGAQGRRMAGGAPHQITPRRPLRP